MSILLFTGLGLAAESSDYPLAINLPTTESMQFWDVGLAFTHRFVEPANNHSKDLYGLDSFATPALGLALGIKYVQGLNLLLYRTADDKTFLAGFQQLLVNSESIRVAARVSRFDELVAHKIATVAAPAGFPTPGLNGETGLVGTTVTLPVEIFTGNFIISVVPSWISATATRSLDLSTPTPKVLPRGQWKGGLFNAGLGLRYSFTPKVSLMTEYYPKPSRLPGYIKAGWVNGHTYGYQPGYAAGVSYKTFKHRFTLLATNIPATAENQVLSGDHAGGPRQAGFWSLGFNVVRTY